MSRPLSVTAPICLLLLFSTVAGLARSEQPAAITAFGEEVDPDGDCDITEVNGVTTITIPGAWHDLTHTDTYDRLNAPRLLDDADGDFTIRVKLDAYAPPDGRASSGGAHTFVSAGLLIWLDDDRFIRVDRAAVPGSQFVWVERFENGKSVSQDGAELTDCSKPIWLRVTRSDDEFQIEQSKDGNDWAEVHVLTAKLPARLRVGVHAINTTDKPHAVKFSEYRLTP